MADLFNDGGVLKTIIRSSADTAKPKVGDEVALVYSVIDATPPVSNRNLVYTIGTNVPNLFVPLRTLDRIVCDMKRNEKCTVHISPAYSGCDTALDIELTLVHIRAGLSPLQAPLGDLQQHLLRNPDVMEQMMESPMMQSLLSNPDTMRSLMGSNPQMAQLMEQNPELNNLMNDPEFLQQSMEAMRNPNVMREMMRNTDRAMSNIESLPGGSAALHKMYNEVQAPLFEASQSAMEGPDSKVKDAKQLKLKYGKADSKPTVQPMPNPWATTPPIPTPTVPSQGFDMSAFSQLMQQPGMQQVMGSAARTNPPSGTNPSPQVMQQLFNPASMQAMASLEQSLGMMQRGGVPANGFNSLFGNFLANPQQQYHTQLATLRNMGFTDTAVAIRALERTGGNVDRAVELLISEGSIPHEHNNTQS